MILLWYYPLALVHTAYHTLLFFQQGASVFPAALHRYFTHNAPAVLIITHLFWHPSAEYCLEPKIFTNDCFHKFIAYCNLYLFFAFLPFPLFCPAGLVTLPLLIQPVIHMHIQKFPSLLLGPMVVTI